MLFLLGLAKDAVVQLSQSIKEEKRGTRAIWDTYNLTAWPNSVCDKKYMTPPQNTGLQLHSTPIQLLSHIGMYII